MTEEKFSAGQSLQVIQSMIGKAKNQISENGHLYLLWGWLVLICSITQFLLLKFVHYGKHYLVWLACWLAVIYQFFYLRKEHRRKRVRAYAGSLIGFVWLAFFILIILVGFMLFKDKGDEYSKLINPAFLALYGMPTFLSGILLRFRPLIIGGIGCWVLSIISHFIGYDYQLLLLASAMIIAWIVPGYLLRIKYKQQKS
jgi:FtsH-binding integral membrane protein